MIDALTGQGINVSHACRAVGVSESGYYAWRVRPASSRQLRWIWLAGEITTVHRESGGTYGAHRIKAELRYGRSIHAGHNQIARLMRDLGLHGTPHRRLPVPDDLWDQIPGWVKLLVSDHQLRVVANEALYFGRPFRFRAFSTTSAIEMPFRRTTSACRRRRSIGDRVIGIWADGGQFEEYVRW